MSKSVAPNQTDVFITVRLITDADGTPAESVTAATGGHAIWYYRDGASAVVTDGASAADMTALNDAHTDWEFKHIRDGYYRVAFPDAAFVSGAGSVTCGMDATGISCVPADVTIDAFVKFNGLASAVTSTSLEFPAGVVVKKGDVIFVSAGTGAGQTRLVKSVSSQVATVDAWDTQPSTSASTVVLLPGDETLADGGINVDDTISSRSTLTPSDINTEVTTVVTNGVNTTEISGNTVQGTGVPGDLWRG